MFDSDQEKQKKQSQIFPRKPQPYLQQKQSLQKLRSIQSGSFGQVWQYYNPLKNQFYAIKKMKFNGRKDYRNINEIQREIDLLYKVKHPYLVQLLDHFEDENFEGSSYAYLVMEYVDGKDLCAAIFKPRIELQYNIIANIIKQICEGLQYLHRMKLIHRDIKLQNVMLTSKGKIKIIDLGESNFYGEDISRKTMRGTKSYFCPEVLNHDQQDDRVDVWCVGVILYELVCLESPFQASSEKEIIENIRRFRYPIPEKIKNDKDLLDLLSKIFTWQTQRLSITQLKTHPWIQKNTEQDSIPKYEHILKEPQVQEYRSLLIQEIERMRAKVLESKEENKNMEMLVEKCKEEVYRLGNRGVIMG